MTEKPRGVRDFKAEEMAKRNYVLNRIREVYISYGYPEIETPAFEPLSVLTAKSSGGEEVSKQIFKFKDYGNRLLGLRFDLTVPMARFVAENPQLPKPFKRSQIGRVWRYEEPQAGRFREFWQADVDAVGSSEVESDVEPLTAVVEALKALGFKDLVVKLNNRKLLEEIAQSCGIKENYTDLFRIIDKLEKQGEDYVKKELADKGFKNTEKLLEIIKAEGKPEDILKRIEKVVNNKESLERLKDFVKLAKSFGIYDYLVLDLSLARGLDYYTEIVYEVKIKGAKVGSVAGGGRYDNLIGLYGKEKVPAVGLSIGVERILEIMNSLNMFKSGSSIKALVIPVGETLEKGIQIAKNLRDKGIKTDLDLLKRGISKNLNYANALNIPFAVIIGEKELKAGKVTLRDMKSGEQELISESKVLERLK